MHREEIIRKYFDSWIKKDIKVLPSIFSENTVYVECYGPEYHGLDQILKWFSDWNKNGAVLEWSIKSFMHQGKFSAVEWYFKCDYDGEVSGFDGISLIEFAGEKIVNLKEFQSKAEHYYPYDV